MADTFGAGTPKDEEVIVLYKGESKQVSVLLISTVFCYGFHEDRCGHWHN